MADDALFQPDSDEPLGLWLREERPPAIQPDLRAVAFELSSRGDRVPGRLLLPPEADGPFPWVLLQHGANGSKDEPYILDVAAPWVRAGVAVASIDFPLHGARANPKLSQLLREGLGLEGRPGGPARRVLREFVRQAVIDLRRTVDAADRLPELDAARMAYAGLSLGSIVGATFCGVDPRPQAAALALGGGGFGGPGVDPAVHLPRFAPRPVLFVNMSGDETVPRSSSEALFAAAGEPKEIVWFDGGHRELPGRGVKAMWVFLERHLRA